jgi:hypothetical protein
MAVDNRRPATPFEFDLYISYASPDDETFGDSEPFVTRLVEDLRVRLQMIIGLRPRIWFDKNSLDLAEDEILNSQNESALRASALFLFVLSPAYIKARRTFKELEFFEQHGSVDRIIKLAKYPVDRHSPLPNLLEHSFYRLATNRLPQELQGPQYRNALEQLTAHIKLLLQGLTPSDILPKRVPGSMEVFLCHSSGDKPAVRILWNRLRAEGFAAWLDEKELLPGQKWELEIQKAIDRAGAIIVCLSNGSINKEGFLQREIRLVPDKASEKPEDVIFLIPARLEECSVPNRLRELQWVDLFDAAGTDRLLQALHVRENALKERTSH